jgi:hypothetical protein
MAVIRPPKVTIAVPCWSSWKIGTFFRFFNPLSTSKHSGALMSYKLIALKYPALLSIAVI